jgi:sugar lactone lactonase YvrE
MNAHRFAIVTLIVLLFTPLRAGADSLFVSNFGNGTISKVDLADGTVSTFASGLNNPLGLDFDSSGNLYVAQQSSGAILKFDSSGVMTPFATGLNYYLSGLAVDSANNVYVGANRYAGNFASAILKFNPQGALISTWNWSVGGPGPLQPTGLALGLSGDLFVSDYSGNALYSISPSGVPTLITGLYVNPHGLAFDAHGTLFVGTKSSGRIDGVSPAGTITPFVSGIDNPSGMAFDSLGNMYVGNAPNGGGGTTITKISPGGETTIVANGLDRPVYVVAVPEPGIAGWVVGAALMITRARRARKPN